MSENPVLKDATRARSILATDCGSVLTRKIVIALLLSVCIAGCHHSAPTEQRERNTAVSSATLRVQSLPQYREAEAACQRKEFRKAAQLLEKLPKTVPLTPEETAFCEQQRKICLRDAGLLPLEPPITTPPRLSSNVNCGAFALLKACERLGVPSTLESVRRLAGTNEKGTTLKGLSKAAKALGLKAEGVQVSRQALAEMQVPAIAWVNEDHYITVLGLSGSEKEGTAAIYDPNTQQEEVITQDRLMRLCSGYLLLLHR